ncbi:MAG: hypothetical protein J2P31_07380 [Blastocatellia bacterium]|nr:hypothetical protein [Blastocatellia bacterium]
MSRSPIRAIAAGRKEARDGRAVLRWRAVAAPPRPAALRDGGIDPAGGGTSADAEMPVMPGSLADCRDGRQFLGSRRRLGTRKYGSVVCSGNGVAYLAVAHRELNSPRIGTDVTD